MKISQLVKKLKLNPHTDTHYGGTEEYYFPFEEG